MNKGEMKSQTTLALYKGHVANLANGMDSNQDKTKMNGRVSLYE